MVNLYHILNSIRNDLWLKDVGRLISPNFDVEKNVQLVIWRRQRENDFRNLNLTCMRYYKW